MTRTEDQTRQLFDAWAASYDADLRKEGGPLMGYAQSLKIMDSVLPVEADSQVLDIGIGSGAIAQLAAARGAAITGIDLSEKMLALCQEQHPDYALHVGTFNAISLPDETFDGVVSGFAFHETQPVKRGEACQQMARVLKPGGYLCLLDIMFASESAMQAARERLGRMWDDSEAYAIVGELDTLLHENGFASAMWVQTGPFHWLVSARKV